MSNGPNLFELARLANLGGDISYGRKTEEDRIYAENIFSSLTDKAQSKAEGNKTLQNIIDAAKIAANFIPGVGPAISAAISAGDIVGDTARASNVKFNLTPEQKKRITGSKYEDEILQNVTALKSQVEGATKGQRDASTLSNLLNIGLSLGGLPGVNSNASTLPKTTSSHLHTPSASTLPNNFATLPPKDFVTLPQKFQMPPKFQYNKAFKTDISNIGQFLTGKGTQDSLIKSLEGKDWLKALSETIPGMDTAVGLSQVPIGKTSANYGSLYGPGSSILTRLMTQYGDATSPAMPRYQRKSLRRRIA